MTFLKPKLLKTCPFHELLQNAWRHFDTDGNGRIDKDEFHDFMSSHIVSDRIGIVGRKHSDMIFQKIDDDSSGEIDFGEFLGIIKKNSNDELCIMIDMRAK